MALTPKFNPTVIQKKIEIDRRKIEEAIINRVRFIGEQFVRNARSVNTYKDQTGNLRSSIGYVILKNGQQIFDSFPGQNPIGKIKGLRAAADVEHGNGIVLIVVAGMEYAGYVESRGYDVLTGSSFIAEATLQKSLDQLKKKLE